MLEAHPRREAALPPGRPTTGGWAITGLASIAPVTWGTTYLVTTQWLPPDRPLLSGVLRALPAGLIALLIARRLPSGVWWWRTAALGTLNIGAFFVLLFVAAYRLPGGVAATLSAAQPLIVAGLAVVLLGERPSRWRLGWAVVGVAGIGLMVLRGRLGFDPLGLAAGFAGTAVMAAGTVLTKRWGRPPGVGVLALTGWQLTAGGLLIAPLALAVEGLPPRLDAPALGGYAWLSLVGTGLAYTLWFTGVARLPVTAMSFLPLLSPVVAAALGWLVLGQSLTATQLLGFGLAMVSISAAQLDSNQHLRARLTGKS
ncbi:EamA family transporter [Micromonospora sp. NPDC049114]|uniref:EamA family transporter n=1 Tax=Micromonospora sp. NPDC049114 TaxID=3155498 RepID=UPI0033C188BD